MSQNSRINHIDSLRGMAVLLMVMVHAAASWNPFQGAQHSTLAYVVSGLGGLAAPLFLTLFGWGIFRSLLKNKAIILQAGFLFAAQILVNITSPHLFNTFTPGILSLMGILTLLAPIIISLVERYGEKTFLIIIFSVFIVQLLFPEIQGDGDWDSRVDSSSFSIFISNLFLTGTYPVFPWVIFPLIGAIISTTCEDNNVTLPLTNLTKAIISIGLLFCIISFIISQYNDHLWAHPSADAYLTFFPANTAFIIAGITGVLLIWIFIQYIELTLLNSAGKISLTIYIVHFIPLSLMHHFDTKYDWGLNTSAAIVMLYTIMWVPISAIWLRYLPRLNLESVLKRVRKLL